ncbi:MAG: hypothetical protein SPH95_02660 [Candidatus Aphodosoma sp.]|nr:hypothetical protein [Candidatus Aphodosoma sp.]
MKTRKIIITSSIVVSIILLITMVVLATFRRQVQTCECVTVQIVNTEDYSFVKPENISSFLNTNGIKCVGRQTSEIDLLEVQKVVEKMPIVDHAVCFFNTKGNMQIRVWQKIPKYRVKSASGDYFVDKNRNTFPATASTVAYVPLVTGKLSKEFATNEVYDLVNFIYDDRFLKSAFTQICVDDTLFSLVPRVGNYIVVLGSAENFESKLSKYKTFVKQVYKYNKWNKYSIVSLEYKNQVVCTKREN